MAQGDFVCPAGNVTITIVGGTALQIDYAVLPNPCNGIMFYTYHNFGPEYPGTIVTVNGVVYWPTNDPDPAHANQVGFISGNRILLNGAVPLLPLLCPYGTIIIDLGYATVYAGGAHTWRFTCSTPPVLASYAAPDLSGCSVDVASGVGGAVTGCSGTV